MYLSLAQHGGTSLTYYFATLPHQELLPNIGTKKNKKLCRSKGRPKQKRYPLIMAVRGYCVWGKVVVEVGASPWKSKPE